MKLSSFCLLLDTRSRLVIHQFFELGQVVFQVAAVNSFRIEFSLRQWFFEFGFQSNDSAEEYVFDRDCFQPVCFAE